MIQIVPSKSLINSSQSEICQILQIHPNFSVCWAWVQTRGYVYTIFRFCNIYFISIKWPIHILSLNRYRKYNETDKVKAEEFLLTDFDDKTEYLTVQMFSDAAINPCMNSTYRFVEAVLDALIDMHSGIQELTTFHFGGDEVPGAWEKWVLIKFWYW